MYSIESGLTGVGVGDGVEVAVGLGVRVAVGVALGVGGTGVAVDVAGGEGVCVGATVCWATRAGVAVGASACLAPPHAAKANNRNRSGPRARGLFVGIIVSLAIRTVSIDQCYFLDWSL
jgi:hypothetical protein